MEIIRPAAVSKNGEKASERRKKNDSLNYSDLKNEGDSPQSNWCYDDAVKLNDIINDITPDVARLLEHLKQQIEPLRQKLKQTDKQISLLEQKIKQHIFLPVANRREFHREIRYLLSHLKELSSPPALLLMHFYELEVIRYELGRVVMDRALRHIVDTIQNILFANDILGSLGGNDFAIILSAGDAIKIRERRDLIKNELEQFPFIWDSKIYHLKFRIGFTELEKGISVEDLFHRADATLKEN